MKKRTTRIAACLLMLTLVVSTLAVLPITASAADTSGFKENDLVDIGSNIPWDGTYAEAFAGGSGTASDPYQIATASQLMMFRRDVAATATSDNHYILTADIYMGRKSGGASISSGQTAAPSFAGTLDGKGFTIYNMIDAASNPSGGMAFFGNVTGTIKNINFKGVKFRENSCNVATLATIMSGTAENIYIDCATLKGEGNASAGFATLVAPGATFINCTLNRAVLLNLRVAGLASGFSANDSGKLITAKNCRNNADMSSSGGAGGIFGVVEANAAFPGILLDGCINTGDILVSGGAYSSGFSGGIMAYTKYCKSFEMKNCMNTGTIEGNKYAGGMVGYLWGSPNSFVMDTDIVFENCHNSGSVTAASTTAGYAGGMFAMIAGYKKHATILRQCSNTGDITGSMSTGGLVGLFNYGSAGTAGGRLYVTNCYNTGDITSSAAEAGAIIGSGNVLGNKNSQYMPNVIGIASVYSTGNVTGTSYAGLFGIVGARDSISIDGVWLSGTYSADAVAVLAPSVALVPDTISIANSGHAVTGATMLYENSAETMDGMTANPTDFNTSALAGLNAAAKANGIARWTAGTDGTPELVTNVKIGGATVSLGSTMALNMKVPAEKIDAPADGDTVTVKIATTEEDAGVTAVKGADGYYTASFEGIGAADMAKSITFYYTVSYGDATESRSIYTTAYSITDYITRMYAKETTSAEVKTVLEAMVGYGIEAEKNAYGTTAIASATTGITPPTWTAGYTDHTSDAYDGEALANYVEAVGVRLSGGVVLEFTVKTGVTSMTVNGGGAGVDGTYTAENGVITLSGIHAAMIRTNLTLDFGSGAIPFTVGNYLEVRNTGDEAPLVQATILYMMAARRLLLSNQAVG